MSQLHNKKFKKYTGSHGKTFFFPPRLASQNGYNVEIPTSFSK